MHVLNSINSIQIISISKLWELRNISHVKKIWNYERRKTFWKNILRGNFRFFCLLDDLFLTNYIINSSSMFVSKMIIFIFLENLHYLSSFITRIQITIKIIKVEKSSQDHYTYWSLYLLSKCNIKYYIKCKTKP